MVCSLVIDPFQCVYDIQVLILDPLDYLTHFIMDHFHILAYFFCFSQIKLDHLCGSNNTIF